jgi:hypothetical protein
MRLLSVICPPPLVLKTLRQLPDLPIIVLDIAPAQSLYAPRPGSLSKHRDDKVEQTKNAENRQ